MQTSVIKHRPKTHIAILRKDYLDICDGHLGAAFLLSFFEYWHTVKLSQQSQAVKANQVAEEHGEYGGQDVTLLQFHSEIAELHLRHKI